MDLSPMRILPARSARRRSIDGGMCALDKAMPAAVLTQAITVRGSLGIAGVRQAESAPLARIPFETWLCLVADGYPDELIPFAGSARTCTALLPVVGDANMGIVPAGIIRQAGRCASGDHYPCRGLPTRRYQ